MTNVAASSDIVTMYWRPGCVFCAGLRRGLHRRGLRFLEVNIWEDAAAAAFVRSVAGGNETVPTVVVGQRALVNPSTARVLAAVRDEAPDLLANLVAVPRRRRWWHRTTV